MICAAYVKLMSGRIWVEAEVGQGSRFIFEVRLRKFATEAKQEAAMPSRARAVAASEFKGIRVLVGEGREAVRKQLQAAAADLGLEINFVYDGQAVVDAIRQGRCDICLLDLKLPFLSGIDAARLVRRDISDRFPVIVLTDAEFMRSRDTCLSIGMNDYLAIPVSGEQLKERLREHVLNGRKGKGSPF